MRTHNTHKQHMHIYKYNHAYTEMHITYTFIFKCLSNINIPVKLEEWQHEAAKTAVDVQADFVLARQCSKLHNVIKNTCVVKSRLSDIWQCVHVCVCTCVRACVPGCVRV